MINRDSNFHVTVPVSNPAATHVWRNKSGQVIGTVDVNPAGNYLSFGSKDDALALAAACIKVSQDMERIELESTIGAREHDD
jgi:hypothetical protein